jgi:D-apionolactonase
MPLSRTMTAPDLEDDDGWLAVIERGTPDPRPQGQLVRFGDFSALVMGTELRYVCLGEREILRRVHVAVRDADWDTIPPSSERVAVAAGKHGAELRSEVAHVSDAVEFAWQGRASGDGTSLSYAMAGVCGRDFDYNRIGICAMLPLGEFAGARYTLDGPGGPASGSLPERVGPQAIIDGVYKGLIPPFGRLSSHLHDGLEVTLAFSGEVFEMEDQRNWTDASFKIYSTPLDRPRPQQARRGDGLRQSLELTVRQP